MRFRTWIKKGIKYKMIEENPWGKVSISNLNFVVENFMEIQRVKGANTRCMKEIDFTDFFTYNIQDS